MTIFYDYKKILIMEELNQLRKIKNNSSHKTAPHSRIIVSLSIIDVINLKLNVNDIENIIEDIHGLGESILYVLLVEKMLRDEQHTNRPILTDDDD